MAEAFQWRCKVCTSPNRKFYEDLRVREKTTFKELEERARVLGDDMSYKSFERHFKSHFSGNVADMITDAEGEDNEKAKKEVFSLVSEIRSNLNGLKTLLGASLSAYREKEISPQMLQGITNLYREHRQSLEACERLTSKLTERATLSETEVLKVLYVFAKDYCPTCLEKFKVNLDEYLREKENKHVH